MLASDGAASDFFGFSVSTDGNTILVGAIFEDEKGLNSGAAYVYVGNGLGGWVQEAKLTASDGAAEDHFGGRVAISGDTALVGNELDDDNGPSSGSAYVYTRDGSGNWIEHDKLLAGDGAAFDHFGSSVSIDGDTALVGAHLDGDNGDKGVNSGSVYVFKRGGTGNWVEQEKLTASDGALDDRFGESVAISGDTALVGAHHDDDNGSQSGSAYVFRRNGSGNWIEQAKLTASDGEANARFGVAVSIDGDTTLIGAYKDDDKGVDSGSAYVYKRDGTGNWIEQAKLTAIDGVADALFGISVSVDGDTALIGTFLHDITEMDPGSAYVYTRDGSGTWTEQPKPVASDGAAGDFFGFSVAISGGTALVGAFLDDDNGTNSGSVYIFNSDTDGDGVNDALDNCLGIPNADQENSDADSAGDVCDAFPSDPNETLDTDGNGIGNNADPDDDGDGYSDIDEIAAGSNPLDNTSMPPPDGDINDDGQVDAADILRAIRILTGQHNPTQGEQNRWDVAPLVNGVPERNQQNNSGDYLILQRKILESIDF